MEAKNKKNKVTVPQNGAETSKKRISKTMKAAMRIQGAFDREEVLKYTHSV
ncbi:MAG: hypothetical protein PHT07_11140 [Paludibacter sp.]|nr:hypothetical protein [Paludibacter sp.]